MSVKSNEFTPLIRVLSKRECMGKEDRRAVVLTFLAMHELVLKPNAIFRNLRYHQNITFGQQTTRNILHELVDDDLVRRVDIDALENRDLVDVEKGSKKGAYVITAAGRDKVESEFNADLTE